MADDLKTTVRMRIGGGAHSPGAWKAAMTGEVFTDDGSIRSIASVSHANGRKHANASLIAAAPTMLSALEQSRDFVIPHALRQIIDAAIAKAKS